MNFDMLKFAAGFANIPGEDIDLLQKNSPALARLVHASQDVLPLFDEVKPIIEQATPHIQALLPLLDSAKPHVEALLPLLKQIVPLVQAFVAAEGAADKDIHEVLPMFVQFAKTLNNKG